MKISYISQLFYIAASALTWNAVHALPSNISRELEEFELGYINSLNYKQSNNTIKLIGYKKLSIPTDELPEFEKHYHANQAEWTKNGHTFYDPSTTTLRLYFPVEAALVEHGGKVVEANELGELDLEEITGDCAVIGRKQTDHVTGVEGNIIKDGVIYLADRNRPLHQYGKVYVYDFGVKVVLDHDHTGSHSTRDGDSRKAACMSNHGGGINCSDKFGIHKGRCTHNRNTCMDYNGWFTNCQENGPKWRNFPGSDCDYALGSGHCWNEIM